MTAPTPTSCMPVIESKVDLRDATFDSMTGMNEIIGRYLKAINDPRTVEADVHARYFGSELDDRSLVPDAGARLGKIGFADWFRLSGQPR